MRLPWLWLALPATVVLLGGCPVATDDVAGDSLITAVAGITESGASNPDETTSKPPQSTAYAGSVAGSGDYRLIEIGAAAVGERWTVSDGSGLLSGSSFLVVLLDENFDLLQRQVVSSGAPLVHVVRADSPAVYLGVSNSYGRAGGEFRFSVRLEAGLSVPPPRRQVVWLNFDGETDLSVHGRDGISFAPFDAAMLGSQYDGATDAIKAAIVAAMRVDYAGYNVKIVSSDDGPPPDGAYATVHFGGVDNRLLGLADSVDQYNADPYQHAIIYVESFADFGVMNLSDDEMGQMVGNVASHEFGHLLGLFHTQVPADVMDTTGTAWDLAADQSFLRGELEESVFPFGYENSPKLLGRIVGTTGEKAEDLAKPLGTAKMMRKAALRAMVRDTLRHRCGNCADPDD